MPKLSRKLCQKWAENSSFGPILGLFVGLFWVNTTSLNGHHSRFGTTYSGSTLVHKLELFINYYNALIILQHNYVVVQLYSNVAPEQVMQPSGSRRCGLKSPLLLQSCSLLQQHSSYEWKRHLPPSRGGVLRACVWWSRSNVLRESLRVVV